MYAAARRAVAAPIHGAKASAGARWRTSAAKAKLAVKNKKPLSYHKQVARQRRAAEHVPEITTRSGHLITSSNHPQYLQRVLRRADALSSQHGIAAAVAEFDAKAAAFANPPPLVALTMLERSNLLLRNVEKWEREFRQWQAARWNAQASEPSDEFWDKVGWIDDEDRPSVVERRAKLAKSDDAGAARKLAAETVHSFDQFTHAADADSDDEGAATADVWKPESRETEADRIQDQRSLERALAERLILIVQRKDTGQWTLPGAVWNGGEELVAAAQRGVNDRMAGTAMAWYPGRAPMGFWLQPFDAETQAATQCYGAKLYFYRAEMLNGRLSTNDVQPEHTPEVSDSLAAALEPEYADWRWLTRNEIVAGEYFAHDPTLQQYLHSIMGASPMEEFNAHASEEDKSAAFGGHYAEPEVPGIQGPLNPGAKVSL